MPTLKIEFPSQEALKEFTTWLCESGEQSYWEWMDNQDEERIYKVDFEYHHPQQEQYPQNDPRRFEGASFCRDNVILTTLSDNA
jgi:hypothetical protein